MECCLQQLVVRVWCSRCYGWREDFLVLRESEGCCWLLAPLSRHMCLLERWYGCWEWWGEEWVWQVVRVDVVWVAPVVPLAWVGCVGMGCDMGYGYMG